MALSPERSARFARQLVIPEIGAAGQEKLQNSSVLIIGAGGLGSPAALYLAAAGVGTLGIADSDVVELSNLQRQILHATDSLGRAKVDSACARIRSLDPDVRVIPHRLFVSEENIGALIAPYDFIIEATDNFEAKFLINDACVKAQKPYCHGGVIRFGGQLMTYVPGRGPCYRCVFGDAPAPGDVPTAKEEGVVGAAAGVIGSLQAMEAIKYLLGIGSLLTGTLFSIDTLTMRSRSVPLTAPCCPLCTNARRAAP